MGLMKGLLTNDLLRYGSAGSGLLLILFLVVHLAGLIPALIAPALFEAYASSLHQAAWLPPMEIALAATTLLHISLTLLKVLGNRRAGNTASLASRRNQPLATLAARSTVAAGMISLGFLVMHLQQLRWPRPLDGGERLALVAVLNNPLNAVVYGAAALAVALHLVHGSEAAHRSLGWLTPTNSRLIRGGGRAIAGLLGVGFLLISLGLALSRGS